MAIAAGRLDRRITINQKSETTDGIGSARPGWTALASNIAAQLMSRTGKQVFEGGEQPQADAIFRVRYRSDITVGMRVVYNSINWDIVAINPRGRNEGLDLVCKAVKAG